VRLGADGFGFVVGPTGELTKKPQERSVVLGDGVELGANTCVDRGSWRDTRIGDNTKVDNLVQIGHNVVIGALLPAGLEAACA
jgi:UDP-3-O-[3-hydroxymyristoyl] glucosamine N-acyltransferase